MRIRGMGMKTKAAHYRAIKDFVAFLGHPHVTATPDELRAYQLHMINKAVMPSTFKMRIVAPSCLIRRFADAIISGFT